MKWRRHLEVVPFIILMVILLATIYTNLRFDYLFSAKLLIGVVLLKINLLVYFFNRKWAVGITGLIVLAIFFTLIVITVESHYNAFSLVLFGLRIPFPRMDTRFFPLVVLYVLTSYPILKVIFSKKL